MNDIEPSDGNHFSVLHLSVIRMFSKGTTIMKHIFPAFFIAVILMSFEARAEFRRIDLTIFGMD